jgi:hypothetical protein
MGSLHPHHVFPRALVGLSELGVEQVEERALVHVVVADVEGRVNVLLHQLDDAYHRGVGEFFFLFVFLLLRLQFDALF